MTVPAVPEISGRDDTRKTWGVMRPTSIRFPIYCQHFDIENKRKSLQWRGANLKSGPLLFLNAPARSLLPPPALNGIILVAGKQETETKRLSLLNNSIPSALLSLTKCGLSALWCWRGEVHWPPTMGLTVGHSPSKYVGAFNTLCWVLRSLAKLLSKLFFGFFPPKNSGLQNWVKNVLLIRKWECRHNHCRNLKLFSCLCGQWLE